MCIKIVSDCTYYITETNDNSVIEISESTNSK